MCGMQKHNEESGLFGIFTNLQKKDQQKIERQTALMKSLADRMVEQQKTKTAQEENKIKTIKIIVIGFATLIIVTAIIIAVVKLKQNQIKPN